MKKLTAAAFAFSVLGAPAFAAGHATGDAEAGEKVFNKCKACHSVVSAEDEVIVRGGRNGPNLWGVFDRVAGSDEEFGKKYGDSLVEAGAQGLQWNEEDFVVYLADPKKFLQTTLDDKKARSKMSFRVKDEGDARDVWAYLVSVGPEVEAEMEAESDTTTTN